MVTKLLALSSYDVLSVDAELHRAQTDHGVKFASFHEAYAVLEEEVHELRDEMRKKRAVRKREDIRKELIQIAAMAHRCLASLDVFVGEAQVTQASPTSEEKEAADIRQSAPAAAAGEPAGPGRVGHAVPMRLARVTLTAYGVLDPTDRPAAEMHSDDVRSLLRGVLEHHAGTELGEAGGFGNAGSGWYGIYTVERDEVRA